MTELDEMHTLYEVRGTTALITLNRPERGNAYDIPELAEIQQLFTRADVDPHVRAVVITGAGKHFCTGGAMTELDTVANAEPNSAATGVPDVLARFGAAIRKPVVAAVNGAAAGSGLTIALAADIRFASPQAKFTTTFARLGLAAERAIDWYLTRIVGWGNALDLLLSARVIGAVEAERMGLVNRVVEQDDLLPTALAWADEVGARCSPKAVASIKSSTYANSAAALLAALADAEGPSRRLLEGSDFNEGIAVFLEKRLPNFEPLDAY